MPPRFVDAEELRRVLSMKDAIEALDQAFALPLPSAPERSHLDTGTGDLLLMPAWNDDAAGVKLVTVAPDNPAAGLPLIQGVYVLFDKPSLAPVMMLDAAALTALRTAAVSGVATKHLAKKDASSLAIFGAGVQAHAHLEAMVAVRPINTVYVVSPTASRRDALIRLASEMGLDAAQGGPEVVAAVDLVCTCTSSDQPVFDGRLLVPGTHVNAVGSYQRDHRELDDFATGRARVVVDSRTALKESGDLIGPIEGGVLVEENVQELTEVLSQAAGRSDNEITIFKSVGAAFEDLVVAGAAAARL